MPRSKVTPRRLARLELEQSIRILERIDTWTKAKPGRALELEREPDGRVVACLVEKRTLHGVTVVDALAQAAQVVALEVSK